VLQVGSVTAGSGDPGTPERNREIRYGLANERTRTRAQNLFVPVAKLFLIFFPEVFADAKGIDPYFSKNFWV